MAQYGWKKQITRKAQKKLKKTMETPARKAQEEQFALEHQQDSDEALYEYVKALKRQKGRGLRQADTVGYAYLIRRLGPWPAFMTRINAELEAERALAPAGSETTGKCEEERN